jgi:hypothetical protein
MLSTSFTLHVLLNPRPFSGTTTSLSAAFNQCIIIL